MPEEKPDQSREEKGSRKDRPLSAIKLMKERWIQSPAALTPCSTRRVDPSWAPFGLTEEGLADLQGLSRPDSETAGPCVLEGRLHGADLSRSDLPHMRLRDFLIQDSICRRGSFEDGLYHGTVRKSVFEDTDFRLTFLGGQWTDVSFVRCRFRRTTFLETAVLTRCVFDSCKFGSFEFDAVELRNVEFRGDVEGLTLAALPRIPMDRHRGMAPRFVSASFRDARLRKSYFVRGIDLRKIVFPAHQAWVVVRDFRKVIPGIMKQLGSSDPANVLEYGRLEYMLPVDQPDTVFMLDDLLEEYGETAGKRIWDALGSCGEVNVGQG